VKSTISHTELADIIEKAKSIKALKRSGRFKLTPSNPNLRFAENPQIYFFGFAYRSLLSLESARDYVQKKMSESGKSWGVSSLIILSDKNGKPGLITNIDRIEIKSLKIDARIEDPVASVEAINDGEALFTFYLQLMQALQSAEANALAPDYLAYARTAGLGTINLTVGELGIQNLPYREALEVLKNAHNLPDKQVLEAWYFLMKLGEEFVLGGSYYNDDTIFTIEDEIFVKDPTPSDVWHAANNFVQGSLSDKDYRLLDQLVGMLRKVSRENTFLSIVSPRPPDSQNVVVTKL
ncbi:MAG: hypothetical protein AAF614_27120, partial [Chloroflexota bacterium]